MPGSFRDLKVYQKAFAFAMKIFEITKEFPPEEKFELINQIRRSSRAVCRVIGEVIGNANIPGIFQVK